MDCSKLNEIFNCDGPEWIEEVEYEPTSGSLFTEQEKIEKQLGYCKKWYKNQDPEKNKERNRKKMNNYREKNADKWREYQREYHKKYREKNSDKWREYQREYHKKYRLKTVSK